MKPDGFWDGKRYCSLDWYLKNRFGGKVYKIALDGGMTCPNRDGRLDTRGCIFCSARGSGDFAAGSGAVTARMNRAIEKLGSKKHTGNRFIAYFQSFTNTYAPVSYLEPLFTEAIRHPQAAALAVATRPDCLPDAVLSLLTKLNQYKPVFVELGFQTAREDTARFIRRCYSNRTFEDAVFRLRACGLSAIVHIILGLPFETKADMLSTVRYLSVLPIDGIKLQLLHVLKGTDLADRLGEFHILTLEEYVDLVVCCLEYLPPSIVIHRITGDGPGALLLAPEWSRNKRAVMNRIHQELKNRDTWQGRLC